MASARTRRAHDYAFTGKVELIDYGRMQVWVVFLPKELASKPPFYGSSRLRMEGTIGGRDAPSRGSRREVDSTSS